LERLSSLLHVATVPALFYFTTSDWCNNMASIIRHIQADFDGLIAVRSSAQGEDGAHFSMAGAYHSVLGVDSQNPVSIRQAIDTVIAAYLGNPHDQVLIQQMPTDIAVSGVVMTHNLDDGSPYYVINYDDESGRTDSITGGTGANKTVMIYHGCNPAYIESARIRKILEFTQEIESVSGSIPLDVEFGLRHDNSVCLFQARAIASHHHWDHHVSKKVVRTINQLENYYHALSQPRDGIVGDKTTLGIMPDWNPAEIIGTCPRPLAVSLYRKLITQSTWREARHAMGYRSIAAEELMVLLCGRPYIDVRNSFNSFLPQGLSNTTARKMVNAWLRRIDQQPELHDKIEFEIVQTIADFNVDDDFKQRYHGVLTDGEFDEYKSSLHFLTNNIVDLRGDKSLSVAEQCITNLAKKQGQRCLHFDVSETPSPMQCLVQIRLLLDECNKQGTLAFAILARHGFVAESLLRSAVCKGAISEERAAAFKYSIQTVSGELASNMRAVCDGISDSKRFIERFGHLRPGTYDIMSLRYADRDDFFTDPPCRSYPDNVELFCLTRRERYDLNRLLIDGGFRQIDADSLIEYMRRAIVGREYGKFVFTRNLSDALEWMACWGRGFNLSRDDVSYLPVDFLLDTLFTSLPTDSEHYLSERVDRGRDLMATTNAVKPGYLIRDICDIHVVPVQRSAPNFIGKGKQEGRIVVLYPQSTGRIDLYDKFICIENADPGFDWIFSKPIKGLITKYGGVNSHMAIRCAEFGLPAAIGCGEQLFDRLMVAGQVELDCSAKILRPMYCNQHLV